MKKKHSGGGGANWMDTYGDMVTLLLCFFVMLYSMSSMDQQKWMALVESFNPDAQTQQTSGGSQSTDQLTQERLKDLIDQAVSRCKDPRFLADSVEKLRRMDEVNRKVLVEYVSHGKTTQP